MRGIPSYSLSLCYPLSIPYSKFQLRIFKKGQRQKRGIIERGERWERREKERKEGQKETESSGER